MFHTLAVTACAKDRQRKLMFPSTEVGELHDRLVFTEAIIGLVSTSTRSIEESIDEQMEQLSQIEWKLRRKQSETSEPELFHEYEDMLTEISFKKTALSQIIDSGKSVEFD